MTQRLPVGGTISTTFDVYTDNAGPLIQVSAIIWAVPALLSALLTWWIGRGHGISTAVVGIVGGLGTAVISMIASLLLGGVLTLATRDAVDGTPVDAPRPLVDRARPFIGPLFSVAMILFAIAVVAMVVIVVLALVAGALGAIAAIVAAVAGIYYGVRVSVASAVVVLEGKTGMDALRRSIEVTEGVFWPLLGIVVIVGIIAGIASAIAKGLVGIFLNGALETFVGTLIGQAVFGPLSAIAVVIAYLTLTRGAGNPTTGTEAGTVDATTTPQPPTYDSPIQPG